MYDCIIIESLEARVGLESTFYQIAEDDGVVDVCVIVYQPATTIDCLITLPFAVFLSSNDGSASVCMMTNTLPLHFLQFWP